MLFSERTLVESEGNSFRHARADGQAHIKKDDRLICHPFFN